LNIRDREPVDGDDGVEMETAVWRWRRRCGDGDGGVEMETAVWRWRRRWRWTYGDEHQTVEHELRFCSGLWWMRD
jgi:hypothetical protein